jgi:hypothetical protein
MGFALWIDGDTLWAAGTHEYRPMGAAVVGAGSCFTSRDFRRYLQAPPRYDPRFAGLFASLGELNDFLRHRTRRRRHSQALRIYFKPARNRVIPPF